MRCMMSVCFLSLLAMGCVTNSIEGPCESLGDIVKPGQPHTAGQVKDVLPHLSGNEFATDLLNRKKGLHVFLLGSRLQDRWMTGSPDSTDLFHYRTRSSWFLPFWLERSVGYHYVVTSGKTSIPRKVQSLTPLLRNLWLPKPINMSILCLGSIQSVSHG